jgi:hypothetical protein
MNDLVSDKVIERFVAKINAFLSLYDVCFIGGAFVFEDDDAKLYNLLTYNSPHVNNKLCHSSSFPSKLVSFKQSKTHGVFLSKYSQVSCIPKIKLQMLGCKESRCIKFEREIDLNHICDVCKPDNQRVRNDNQNKRVILYYPFMDTSTNKRYLYVKLESYKMISTGHLIEASKTYILKTKMPERRESDRYIEKVQEMDNDFYRKMSQYFGVNASALDEYNSNMRNGSEFFVSSNLLDMFLDLFLNSEPVSSVCTNPALNPTMLNFDSIHSSKSFKSYKSVKSIKSNKSTNAFKSVASVKSKSPNTIKNIATIKRSMRLRSRRRNESVKNPRSTRRNTSVKSLRRNTSVKSLRRNTSVKSLRRNTSVKNPRTSIRNTPVKISNLLSNSASKSMLSKKIRHKTNRLSTQNLSSKKLSSKKLSSKKLSSKKLSSKNLDEEM